MDTTSELIGMLTLATRLMVPGSEIRRLAQAGQIPCLRVGSRYLFNQAAVEAALAKLAATSYLTMAQAADRASAAAERRAAR